MSDRDLSRGALGGAPLPSCLRAQAGIPKGSRLEGGIGRLLHNKRLVRPVPTYTVQGQNPQFDRLWAPDEQPRL